MDRQWFLIKSLDVTIDLNLITQVFWNNKGHQDRVYTKIIFGTDVGYDSTTEEVVGNEFYLHDRRDREDIRAALISLGLPAPKLLFESDEGKVNDHP